MPDEPALLVLPPLVLPPLVLPPLALVAPAPPALLAPFGEDEPPQPSARAIVEPTANEPQRYLMRAC